jgi:integrase
MTSKKASGPEGRALTRTRAPGVYRRGSGFVVRVRDQQGRQVQRAARTMAEAKRLRAELTADVARREYRAETRITLGEYAAEWIETYRGTTAAGIRPETLHEYRRDLLRAVEALGPRRRLADLGTGDLRALASDLFAAGLGARRVRGILTPLRLMFADAEADGLIRHSPATGLRVGGLAPPAEDGEPRAPRALSAAQLAALIEAAPEGWKRTLVRVVAHTGLRISEALALRWRDLDVAGRELSVRQRVRDGRAGAPKTARARRSVPLAPELARELAALRLASRFAGDNDLIFPTSNGTPYYQVASYVQVLRPAAAGAGLAGIGWHTLRRTAASRWLAAGIPLATVSALLGHADPSITLRAYTHAIPADRPDGATLAAALGLG